jgi:2',3'-cyclic-nucleotide 2'-phosphodiesterase/3'-nucleotidase
MHLLGYDYFADRADARLGLAGLADLIDELRQQNEGATLLLDNGDFLQGNPLADIVAATLGADEVHPMIAAMNILGYDAITLGNHEFDFGLTFLRRALQDAKAAVVSANIQGTQGPALAAPFRILTRDIRCDDGTCRPIKIGVTGFAPPQIAGRDHDTHLGQITVADIVACARLVVPQIQAAGADVIIALCHSGIGKAELSPLMENAAVPLAAVDGLDVVLTGHTHEQFPDPARAPTAQVDPLAGTLHGKPAVMAGFYGTSLGVIDLDVGWTRQGWQIQSHTVRALPPLPAKPAKSARQSEIEDCVAEAHIVTLQQMRNRIAATSVPIQNYFATIQPDLSMQLLARAMRDAVSEEHHGSPVLAAVSPFRFGGRNGLGHYIDIAAGELALRDAAAIFPFADRLCAVRRSGAQIKDWLERSASHYNRIAPDTPVQPLLNPRSAAYNCDAIYGLTYDIDLSQPARFDVYGNKVAPRASRIRHVRLGANTVADDDVFVVAINSFRARGGGGFAQIPHTDFVWRSPDKLRDILIASLQKRGQIDDTLMPVWRFCPITGTRAQFQTAAQAKVHMPDTITHIGDGADGFETYSLKF